MKKVFLLAFAALLPLFAGAQSVQEKYIEKYAEIAVQEMLRSGVPASITLAQGIFESGAGQSELALKGNNHFGIKCHGWQGRTIYHDDDYRGECFRAYSSPYESYEDHSRFLANSQRYRSLFSLKKTDYQGWARGLKAAGYATNPRYANQLIELIQLYRLYQYDSAKDYDHFLSEHTKDRPVQGKQLHPIKMYNKNYYVYARRGDTFRLLGEETGISYRKLAKYNERHKNDPLREGEIVWLKKKQKRAPKDYKDHLYYVRQGDSMYSIAQKYGIRVKSLYRLNRLRPDYELHVGDALRLY